MKRPAPGSRDGAALWLAPEAPYPLSGGGALRSASLLEYLARRYPVDAVVFQEPGAPDPRPHIPRGLVRDVAVMPLPYHRRHPAARALRNAARLVRRAPPLLDRFAGFGGRISEILGGKRYEVAVIEHFWCAPYWEQVAPRARRTVLDLHNIESVLHARCAAAAGGAEAVAHGLFASACRARERRWLPKFSCLLAASAEDAGRIAGIAPGARVLVYPNALPPREAPARAEQEVVAFSGNLEYHPNVGAVRFFAGSVWPRLRARHPGLVWRLVGKNEAAVRRFIGAERIECTGPVADPVEELARAKVAVVPLLAGSGTRLKILEAWAAATPVVSTALGAEGLPAVHGDNILIADGAEDFARAVEALLSDPCLRDRIGRAGRATFDRGFTWPAAWDALDRAGGC